MALLLIVTVVRAAETASTRPTDQSVTFTQSDPRSGVDAQRKAGKVTVDAGLRYDIKDEHFTLYVPATYDETKPFGLMVWISAGGRGTIPHELIETCDRHDLIAVAADNSGNDRPIPLRLALALDAAFNLQQQYKIDVSRIYASGVSGGGKMASILPILYADTFTGAIPIVGIVYYRPIALPNDPTRLWAPTFYPPSSAILDRAKAMSRLVLITGSGDMNRESIDTTYRNGFMLDRFQHVEYVEVPGMGHQLPPAERLEAAVQSLDKPLPSLMPKTLQMAQQALRTKHIDQARALFEAVTLHGDAKLAAQAATQLKTFPTTQPR